MRFLRSLVVLNFAVVFMVPAATAQPSCSGFSVTISQSGGPLCSSGGQVTLTAHPSAGDVTYRWLGGSINGATVDSVPVSSDGLYSVEVTQPSTGCTARASTTVELVHVNLGVPYFGCGSGEFELQILNDDADAWTNINWTLTDATLVSGQGTPVITVVADPDAAMDLGYIIANVTANDPFGCPRQTRRQVSLLGIGTGPTQAVSPHLFPVGPLCAGREVIVGVAEDGTYDSFTWNVTGGTIVRQDVESIAVQIDPGATNLHLDVQAKLREYGCPVEGSADFPVTPAPEISTASSACAGSTHAASVESAGPIYDADWTIVNGQILSGQGSRDITWRAGPSGDVTLGVQIRDSCGELPLTTTIPVGAPGVTLDAETTQICAGDEVAIEVTLDGTPPFHIVWSDGFTQDVTTTSATRLVSPAETTQYSIVSVSDAACGGASSEAVTIGVDAAPQIVEEPKNVVVARGRPATMSVQAGDGTFYRWYEGTRGDLSRPIPGAIGPTLTIGPITTRRTFWVRVETACGAIDSRTATVDVSGRRRAVRSSPEP